MRNNKPALETIIKSIDHKEGGAIAAEDLGDGKCLTKIFESTENPGCWHAVSSGKLPKGGTLKKFQGLVCIFFGSIPEPGDVIVVKSIHRANVFGVLIKAGEGLPERKIPGLEVGQIIQTQSSREIAFETKKEIITQLLRCAGTDEWFITCQELSIGYKKRRGMVCHLNRVPEEHEKEIKITRIDASGIYADVIEKEPPSHNIFP